MKKILAAMFLCAVCLFCMTACGIKTSYIDYKTGIDAKGNFDSELFFYNRSILTGADPGIIYVPAERDPVYGGYFYAYTTGCQKDIPEGYDDNVAALAVPCYRTKNFSEWESAGVFNGNARLVLKEDGEDMSSYHDTCAPEVYYDESERMYYMIYSIEGKPELFGENNELATNRIFISKSETPVGPFESVYVEDEDGNRLPPIDVARDMNLPEFGMMDGHIFFDGDDKYLYFDVISDTKEYSPGIYGLKLLSWTEADYSTLKNIVQASYTELNDRDEQGNLLTGEAAVYTGTEGCATTPNRESDVNEGAYMVKHNGKYYLTYSANGYTDQGYSVYQAVSDSPLGHFVKTGNAVCDGGGTDYAKGVGHHAFVEAGGEMFIFYHKHSNVLGYDGGRVLAIDRCVWTKNEKGEEILTTNGPSRSLQWLPESISGYKNVMQNASVSAKGASGTEYVKDGMLPFYSYNDTAFMTASGDVTVKIEFPSPVSVKAIMVYNATDIYAAFSKIKRITFRYAEKEGDYEGGVIDNLAFPQRYYDLNAETLIPGAAATAVVDDLLVTEITLEFAAGDKLLPTDQLGNANTSLQIGEIVVLGRENA